MSTAMEVATVRTRIRPRTKFDRSLSTIAHQKAWEWTPEFLDGLVEQATRCKVLSRDRSLSHQVRQRYMKEYRMCAMEVLARTLPTVSRVDAKAVLRILAPPIEEQKSSEDQERALVRGAITRFAAAGLALVPDDAHQGNGDGQSAKAS